MHITLASPIARDRAAEPYDVKQLKKALNRLGLYAPLDKTGITGIADAAMFDALKQFQTTRGLKGTGTIKSDDETIAALNSEISVTPTGSYIWRTVEDDKVRGAHAAFNRTTRSWADSPDPGEDYNCRCWAVVVTETIPIVNLTKERIQSILKNTPAIFEISIDKEASAEAPWYESSHLARKAVVDNKKSIEYAAKKYKIDPDLVRAVMWAENARGGYLGAGYLLDKFKMSKTVMPMNINPDLWHSLIAKEKDHIYNPELNVENATMLLSRIQDRLLNPTPAKIAAIWQFIGQEKTNNYAAYIERIYNEKPWNVD